MTAAKLKNLAPAYARLERLKKISDDAYLKSQRERRRIRHEGARVAAFAIKAAKWKRGKTLLAMKDRGWAIGIYQGASLNYPPSEPGKPWSFLIHTLSVRANGKPGTAKLQHSIEVSDPALLPSMLKIVGVIGGQP